MKLSRIQIRRLIESVLNENVDIASSLEELKKQKQAAMKNFPNNENGKKAFEEFEQQLSSEIPNIYRRSVKSIFEKPGARDSKNYSRTLEKAISAAMNELESRLKQGKGEKMKDTLLDALTAIEVNVSMSKSGANKLVK